MAKSVDPGHIKGPVFIPSVATVRIIWQLANGKQAHNILHGSYTAFAFTTVTQVNTLFTAISNAWTSSGYKNVCPTSVELFAVGVRDMAEFTPGVGHGEIISNLAAVPGTATGSDALPANVALVVSLKTGLSLQANRGRVYLPGWAEVANDPGGTASTIAVNAAAAFVTSVSAAMTAQGLTLTIAHPARQAYTGSAGAAHAARPAGHVDVTSIATQNNVWDSTRLRSLR